MVSSKKTYSVPTGWRSVFLGVFPLVSMFFWNWKAGLIWLLCYLFSLRKSQ